MACLVCGRSRVRFPKTDKAKSYTALQTVRHRFNISAGSCVVMAV